MAGVPPAQPRPEQYRIEEFPEVVEVLDRIRLAPELGLDNPYFLVNDGVTRDTSIIGGAEVVNFSSYNYLGMSGHPAVTAAVQDAVARYGSSCSSSRLLSGREAGTPGARGRAGGAARHRGRDRAASAGTPPTSP